ncbi:sperm-associated acrosin inhibitor-like [Panthera tigris]|uniref:sperm-associated acrosin inhibitor-like n=1 Tax=Panthera tigris TaxID=9694 RepID=UPI001C6F701E|nr:sperm-associated acrosin inhibitor-like [Panthera tigris]
MSLFSSWIKAIFIIALAFPLYSETTFAPMPEARSTPQCRPYSDEQDYCTRESDLICANNGKTYGNICTFCREKKKNGDKFDFAHFGYC